MESNGWKTEIDNVHNGNNTQNIDGYAAHCGKPPTFYGYKLNQPIGRVTANFEGSGKAILNFGNCWYMGQTKVYMNYMEIASAEALNNSEVKFDYKFGDVLKLEEQNMGIIKLNSLKLTCNGT